jgi:5-bromo-4-chloroindolyl phosphate hydrolysis protein
MDKKEKKSNERVGFTGKTREDFNRIFHEGFHKIKEMYLISENIADDFIKDKVYSICTTTREIYNSLEKHPEDINIAREFIYYYMDSCLEIVNKYQGFTKSRSQKKKQELEKIKKMIVFIDGSMKKQLDKMYENDIMSLNVEIKVLKTAMKSQFGY